MALGVGRISFMELGSTIEEIRGVCHRIAGEVTALHRGVGKLPDGPERGEMLKSMFELTRHVEVVKKQLRKLESGDTTRLV